MSGEAEIMESYERKKLQMDWLMCDEKVSTWRKGEQGDLAARF